MNQINNNMEFLTLLFELSQINNAIILKPVDDKISVIFTDAKEINDDPTLAVKVEAPLEYFNASENIPIFKYSEFYKFVKSQKDCKIFKDDNNLIIKNSNSELLYPLSDEEMITYRKIPSKFDKDEAECDFVYYLTAENIQDLSSKISNIKPDVGTNSRLICDITYNNQQAEIGLKLESYKPSFKLFVTVGKYYNTEYENKKYSILPNVFQYLPKGKDFMVLDIFEKVVIFKMIDPNITLNIVTWKIYE